jgi:UDP-N-acetylmuramoylalanine--D-glutamate ligase
VDNVASIALLGDGITARAVRETLATLNIPIVPVEEAQWIVVSPGIPPEKFPDTSAEIISEIELAWRLFHVKQQVPTIIGVTGTNGKSTVTALIAHLLQCPALGNIGTPLITAVADPPPVLVVELSSYQLATCSTFCPDVSIILNLSPDHLEWHKSMEHYTQSKLKICQCQSIQQACIIPESDPYLDPVIDFAIARKIRYSAAHPSWPLTDSFPLPGDHNRLNALAAILAAQACHLISKDTLLQRLSTFQGLPHRIEKIATIDGRTYYNDSKGTNPDATLIAVKAFTDPIRLILGGKDKGLELTDFLLILDKKVASIDVFGEVQPRIMTLAGTLNITTPIRAHTTLKEALDAAKIHSQAGDVILLSPACSSFDQFENFEHRGDVFRELTNNL